MTTSKAPGRIALAALAIALTTVVTSGAATAATDPPGCTQNVQYDPAIPTFKQYADGAGIVNNTLGGFSPGTANRHPTNELYGYFDAMVAATSTNPRVRVIERDLGTSYLGKPMRYYVVGTPDNLANLDSGRNDGAFWRGVREGTISAAVGALQAQDRPAFFWNTAAPHGNEPAAGEAISRVLYELAARTDCANMQRLQNLDNFLMPVTNPDGRDNNVRTTAFGFDPNRDFASRNQDVNASRVANGIIPYPGPVYIDAHQQSTGYFFPPNEDPVHHEMSDFTINLIQRRIGPALQQKFNDQSGQYRNYNTYDLFAIEYGDSVPSLQLGAAGVTFEKGNSESYGKQVYDHYLAMDETMNVISDGKQEIMAEWSRQWEEAANEGGSGQLEQNQLVSPLTPAIIQEPNTDVFGYYYLPNNHAGDTAKLVREMRETGVHVYRLDAPVSVPAAHNFSDLHAAPPSQSVAGQPGSQPTTLPAGTLYIPMDQTQKHWIQGILGEDPFIPVPYFYDVVDWSFSQARGMSGNGFLTQAMPAGAAMTEINGTDYGHVSDGAKPVMAFATDSAQGMGMMVDLLAQNVTVSRSDNAFNSGGVHFPTGTALLDASTLGAVDLNAMSNTRQTPVYGLDAYPTARHVIAKPKIGLYVNSGTVPTNPLGPTVGHCGAAGGNVIWCEALHVLAKQLNLSYGTANQVVQPVTTTDLTAASPNDLTSRGFTALINPNQAVAAGANATALQTFVNNGGRYVGDRANGLAAARTAGFTNLNTQATNTAPFQDQCYTNQPSSLQTPGTFFTASYDTSNPLAWGFDNGGFAYRESSADPVYNPATLAGIPGPPAVPNTNAAISYSNPLTAFGYTCNAIGAGELPGRPIVTESAFGAGHSTVIGVDPWFRSWIDFEWRWVLNGALYPTGASIPAGPAPRKFAAGEPATKPLAKAALPKVADRPVWVASDKMDARVVAYHGSEHAMHRMLHKADAPARAVHKARYETEGNDLVMVLRKAWTPGDIVKPWLFRLGLVASNTDGVDTNIPARSH